MTRGTTDEVVVVDTDRSMTDVVGGGLFPDVVEMPLKSVADFGELGNARVWEGIEQK